MKMEKRAFYVYAYLRDKDDNWGYAGTPYYIGKGTGNRKDTRKIQRCGRGSRTILPEDANLIVVLKDKLYEGEAHELEKKLIYFYGRIDKAEGCLMNLTDGGEGTAGYTYTEELRELRRRQLIGNNYGSRVDWTNPNIKAAHAEGIRNIIYVKTAARRRQDERLKIEYEWEHPEHGKRKLCCIDMSREYGGDHKNYWFAANGKIRAAFGWICLNPEVQFVPKVVNAAEVAKKAAKTRNMKGAEELGIPLEEYEKMSYSARYKAKKNKREAAELGIPLEKYKKMNDAAKFRAKLKMQKHRRMPTADKPSKG